MRVLDFTDGFTSAAEPTQGTINNNAVKTFADDAAYVTDKGSAAADGDLYYNTTNDTVRLYANSAWVNVNKQLQVFSSTANFLTWKLTTVADGDAFYDSTDDVLKIYEDGAWVGHDIDGFTPTTTQGDLLVEDGSNVVRLGVGSDDQVLTADSGEATGLKWATPAASGTGPSSIQNLGAASSVGSSALTIALKQSDGSTDATGGSPINISMRSSTAATGSYNLRTVTAALSITVPSGATLGHTDADDRWVYIYALDNAGTIELAVSANDGYDENEIQSTTLLDTSADSADAIYSSTARSNVPIRLLGKGLSTQTTAGTWDANLTKLATTYVKNSPYSEVHLHTDNGLGSGSTKIRRFTTTVTNIGSAITYADSATLGATFTINEKGPYSISYSNNFTGGGRVGISLNSTELTTDIQSITAADRLSIDGTASGGTPANTSTQKYLKVGDVIRAHDDAQPGNATDNATFIITKVSN